jgi:hypothetical protein
MFTWLIGHFIARKWRETSDNHELRVREGDGLVVCDVIFRWQIEGLNGCAEMWSGMASWQIMEMWTEESFVTCELKRGRGDFSKLKRINFRSKKLSSKCRRSRSLFHIDKQKRKKWFPRDLNHWPLRYQHNALPAQSKSTSHTINHWLGATLENKELCPVREPVFFTLWSEKSFDGW